MSVVASQDLGLTERELKQYNELGFVLRTQVFDAGDLETLRRACEELVTDLQAQSKAAKQERGSYVYQMEASRDVIIKWEGDREHVMGIEPFAHLHPVFNTYGRDERLCAPMKTALGADSVVMYTEKLNLKRAGVGGPVALHQDYPYWVPISDGPDSIATAMVYLDDSTEANGCLQVSPGSQLRGIQPTQVEEGKPNEIDPGKFDVSTLVPVEAKAGDVLFFGSRLVHRSMHNTSAHDRRVLLYSHQPAGHRHLREFYRAKFAEAAQAG